jgi:hypothetical protein
MSFETGGSFSAGQRNRAGSGATGLIQFTGTTAASLLGLPNTPQNRASALSTFADMSQTEQLGYVQQYFENAGFSSASPSNCGQAYLTVFAGAGAKNDNFNQAVGSGGTALYTKPAGGCPAGSMNPYCLNANNGVSDSHGNCGLDIGCTGSISAGDAVAVMISKGDSGYFTDQGSCTTVTAKADDVATEDSTIDEGLSLDNIDQGDQSGDAPCETDACGYADGENQGGTDAAGGFPYDPGAGIVDWYDIGYGGSGGGYDLGWDDGGGGGGGGGDTCFAAGTPITMADGTTRPIERILPGDSVVAYDVDAHTLVASTVERRYVHPYNGQGTVLINGIQATVDHPFYVDGEWVSADHLNVGDHTLSLAEERASPEMVTGSISSLVLMNTHVPPVVYNLEVRQYHDYFAGSMLVHNFRCVY